VVKRCDRCGKWFHETDSAVCNPCWEDMGQMQFWQDEEEYEDPRIERAEWEDRHPIDTIFDRDLNR